MICVYICPLLLFYRITFVSASSNNNNNLFLSNSLRKDVARVLTVIRQKQLGELRKFYANNKYTPLDLRSKKTRAIRRRLTKGESKKETERQRKKRIHFGARIYAVKA